MARSFVSSDDYLLRTSLPAMTSEGSIFLRIKPNWAYNDGAIHVFYQYADVVDGADDRPSFQKYSDSNVYLGWQGFGAGDQRIVVSGSGLFTNGVWANHIYTWDDVADEQFYYVDNSLAASRTLTLTTTTASRLRVGNYDYDVAVNRKNCNASLAEFARWNRVLDAAERAVLEATGCPRLILSGLLEYYPLIGRTSPEIDVVSGTGLTVTGATADTHPRVIHARRKQIFTGGAGGGSSVLLPFMMHMSG